MRYRFLTPSSLPTVISHAEREIDLIREYRTLLVADVATGKLGVRRLAPPAGSVVADEPEAIGAEENCDGELLPDDEDAALVEKLDETTTTRRSATCSTTV